MLDALLWGGVAAASLFLGAWLATLRSWSDRAVGVVLALGAGALIASVAFELAEEGLDQGGPGGVGIGLALGAAAYFLADRAVDRWASRSAHGSSSGSPSAGAAGAPLAIGALLDGIPEQAVLGIGVGAGESVSIALLLAIFLSNLPESIGSSADMLGAGRSRRFVLLLWLSVSVLCALASLAGGAIAGIASPQLTAGINGFAAGALLVMLIDEMIPDARKKAGDIAGVVTVLGFALAAGLSLLT